MSIPPQPAATPILQPALVLPPSAEATLAATERQLLDMQMKEAVREAVERAVEGVAGPHARLPAVGESARKPEDDRSALSGHSGKRDPRNHR